MSNEIQVVNQERSALVPMQFNEQQVELIKKTVAKGTTNDELALFLYTCKKTGLDPLIKQIYAVKRAGTMAIQTGIDGYRLIAERTGKYAPGKEPKFTEDAGMLISATAYVMKKVDGTWHEVAATARYTEYANPSNPIWKKMPFAMLAKCAESLVLRKSFPAEMSGVYTHEEMEQADVAIVEPKQQIATVNPPVKANVPVKAEEVMEVASNVVESEPFNDNKEPMDDLPIELKEGQRVVTGIIKKYFPPKVGASGKSGPFSIIIENDYYKSFSHDFRDLLSKLEGKNIKLVYSTTEYNGKEQYTIEEII